jgi:hypothetical protein
LIGWCSNCMISPRRRWRSSSAGPCNLPLYEPVLDRDRRAEVSR